MTALPGLDTHLDVSLRHNARSTLQWCGILRMSTAAKRSIESVRVQEGTQTTNSTTRVRWLGLVRHMTDSEMVAVFEHLAQELPSLRFLRIRFRGTRLPCQALRVCFKNMELSGIRILNVDLHAKGSQDLQNFAMDLQQCKLQRLTIDLCASSSMDSIHPVMDAVAQSQSIQYLSLNNTRISSPNNKLATKSWLEQLCLSKTLQVLKLEMMDEIQNDHFVCIAQAMRGNHTLKELYIESCNMEQSGCAAIANLLSDSESCGLEILFLQLFAKRRDQQGASGGEKDSPAPSVDGIDEEIDWDNAGMAAAIASNKTLKFLRIFAENITQNGYPDAFLQMIRTNITLEQLILGWDGETSSDIEFFLRLNRNGRNKLTPDASKEQWVGFLTRHADDLSAIVDVFSRNPLLVQDIEDKERILSSD